MVDAQEMQDRGVQVVDADAVDGGAVADFIRLDVAIGDQWSVMSVIGNPALGIGG